MKEPGFWYKKGDIRGHLLAPLGRLYALATAHRLKRPHHEKLDIPVLCVGNINAGGTGKTPTVIALAQRLRDLGHVPHVVSRGHGGTLPGPVNVDPAKHRADQVGDEPLLISAFCEIWVSKDRAAGGRAAAKAGATIVILDDGFQNPALHQDFKIVVVDALRGFGNGYCIPAGPLREPVAIGLDRADAVVSIGDLPAQKSFEPDLPADLPRLQAMLRPLETGMNWHGGSYVAFAGIGQPEKFFETLRKLGAKLIHTEALGDHKPLSPALLSRLEHDAKVQGAQLVTTEKDAARLPPNWRGNILTLPVRLEFFDDDTLTKLLANFPAP